MPAINAMNRQIEEEFAPSPSRARKSATNLPAHTLRRTGERPLSFKGREIMSATSYCPGPSLWHQVTLYQGEAAFAVDIRTYFKREDERDVFFAAECATLDEAIMVIEEHDAASAVPVESSVASIDLPAQEIALRAAMLRLRVFEARQQYRDLVGEILYGLATTASSAP